MRCHRHGPATSNSARCCTGSAPSTGCPNRRRLHSCAVRSCTPHSNSSTRCLRPTRPRDRDDRWSPPRGTASSPTSPTSPTTSIPPCGPQLLDEARALLSGYYRLEDPTRFDPESCEQRVEVELADGTLLRGFVDRIDVAPTGELRVVDYKTGKAPPEARALAEFKAMFQMKFYAVALLRSRGVLPARLRLLYLADGQVLDYTPDLDELERFEKTLIAIWRAIQSAGATGDFRPHPSRLCDWCAHHAHCPVFGGTPPPYPGWPEYPPKAAARMMRCCTGGARRVSDASLYRSAARTGRAELAITTVGWRRRRCPSLRVHRLHPKQLGSRDPARLAATGPDDQAHRGTRRRLARCASAG